MTPQLGIGAIEIGRVGFQLGRPLLLEAEHFGRVQMIEGHSDAAPRPDRR